MNPQDHQQELIPLETGEYLKQQRLLKKLTLATVADAIKLDEQLLGDIERGEAEHIAAIYRKGYIQAYARFLKIPEDEITRLSITAKQTKPLIRNIFTMPPNRNPMDKWLRATSYVVASLLIGTLAWQFTHEAVRLSQGNSSMPRIDQGSAQPQEINQPVNASIASLGALHGSDAGDLDTGEQAWAAIARPALPAGESSLQIAVSADSWIEITDANGLELEMDLLRGGSEKSYHGVPPFRILFGRASAVRLSMDGSPVDLTNHTVDDVAQLTWPQGINAENQTNSEGSTSNQ